jgi:hypothetical protein
MSASLSYFSTLEELISTPDDKLQQDFGYLAPETVINYVMYLRNQLRTAVREKKATEVEVVRLKGVISEQDERLDKFMSRLGANNTPSSFPARSSQSTTSLSIPSTPSALSNPSTPTAPSALPVPSITSAPPPRCDLPTPGPSSTSVSPDCSNSVPAWAWMESIAKLPPINNVLSLREDTFKPGTKIEAVAVYSKGTSNFSIKFTKEPRFCIFKLEFRPNKNPSESEIVMNSKKVDSDTGWEEGIRIQVPDLFERQFIVVEIYCKMSEFKVKVNNRNLRFHYRYPLEDIRYIWVMHGTNSNKWTSLKYNLGS